MSGTLTWKGPNGDAQARSRSTRRLLLVATGPKLEADLTEVKYNIVVAGKPWNGTLHLPSGGTKVIVEGARKAEKRPIPPGKTGPNGGVIQVVGDDTIEVVADKASGQVRVYVLDADLKPVPSATARSSSASWDRAPSSSCSPRARAACTASARSRRRSTR